MNASNPSRRDFIKTAAIGAGAATFAVHPAHGAPQPIRVGLIGTGRRGAGAAKDCLDSSEGVTLTAVGDIFPDQLEAGLAKLKTLGDRYQVPEDQCFSGWDAYKQVLASDIDLVILAAPPGFRPLHLAAAVEAGKHVFMEKPAAVDPAGVRSIIASGEKAKGKGLAIVAGTQRRHQLPYVETLKRIHDGAIGDIVAASCYWVGDYDYYPAVLKQPGWSEMEAQIRNWNYFTWLSGDHIVEQHVHNIDIMNWALRAHPVKALGLGGRQQRTGAEYGHIYDHFAVELEYPGGVRVQSLCRQMKDTQGRVGEFIVGTKGTSDPRQGINGPTPFKTTEGPNPYVQEHTDLIASIRNGAPLNEAKDVAESTMAAIIGRMACYTGQEITWDWAMNESKEDWTPKAYEFGPIATPPVAMPGVTPLV
ncbi:MAG: Gfo/Idh/MocA family oxidoreductase [Candidatus Hydrogenedentes bacterium]|nr:Gfo/Idh/MocA family oxidoreductase [Candidatus Hydrogenedentota bacterium]